jgi:hypothetical protein
MNMKKSTTALGIILLGLGISPLSQATTLDREEISVRKLGTQSFPVEYAINIPRAEDIDYDTYYNNRFEYVVKYPENLLNKQPPPQNNDGRSFVSPEGSIKMRVSGSHNVPERTFSEIYQQQLQAYQQESRVTYQTKQDNWFVISGYRDGNVFYKKTIFYNDDVLDLTLTYDRTLQPEFDPIVAEISRSFMPVGDYQW